MYSDDQFDEKLEQLNALCDNEYFIWQSTKANKTHVDEFGSTISCNETFYKRDIGGFGNVLKLSKASMECFLFTLFANNHELQALSIHLLKAKKEKECVEFEKVSNIIRDF